MAVYRTIIIVDMTWSRLSVQVRTNPKLSSRFMRLIKFRLVGRIFDASLSKIMIKVNVKQ